MVEDRADGGDLSIGGQAFTTYGRPSKTFPEGRICGETGLRDDAVDLQRERVLLPARRRIGSPTAGPEERLTLADVTARHRRCPGRTTPITTGPGAPYTVGVSNSPVSWDVAERVATWVGTRRSCPGPSSCPSVDAATAARLEEDFAEVTAQAEALVIEATGLRPASGEARARVVDRPGWVQEQPLLVPAPPRPRPRPARDDRPEGAHARGGPVGGRGPDGPGPRLDVHPGPRPVRPSLRR